MARPLRRGMMALASACLLTGCGTSDHDQIQAKVEQFVHAVGAREYRTLCDQVLAPSLLGRLAAGGIRCVQAMQVATSNVRNPILSIGRITISGSTAEAITLTDASGQRGALEAIGLVKTGQGWRISSLATPVLSSAHS